MLLGPRRWAVLCVGLVACGSPRLANVTQQPPGPDCPAGGVLIEQGVDDNDDGDLQGSEIDSSELVCDGGDSIVDQRPEPPGTNCANGGTKIRVGIDRNRDGILADDEVQQETYVCSAQPGTPTLVSVEQEPLGANCALGGVVVRSGDDLNHDGALDPTEVTSTTYVCTGAVPVNETINGSFHLRNEFDQAVLVHVKHITGTLFVEPNQYLTNPIAPKLEDVSSVVVTNTFDSLSLPALTTLTNLDISQNADFNALDAPALAIAGNVSITPKAHLANVNLGAMTRVVSNLHIDKAPLTVLHLESLAQIGGELWIRNSPLTSLPLPALRSVGTRAYFDTFSNLTTLSMPLLESVGTLELYDLPKVTAIDLRALTSTSGITLARAPLLAENQFQIGGLTQLSDRLVLAGLPWADVQAFDGVQSTGQVWISEFTSLTTLAGFGNLTSAPIVTIANNPALTSISGFPNIGATLQRLSITGNSQLVSISGFAAVTQITDKLELSGNGLIQLDAFPNLATVYNLVIDNNAKLTSVTGFAGLTTASGLYFTNNPALTSIGGLANVQTIAGLQAIQNPKLAAISMPALQTATQLVVDAPLTTAAFPALTDGAVRLDNARLLDVSGFSALKTGGVFLTSAPELTTYSLPLLQTGGATITFAPKLTSVDLPALTEGGLRFDTTPVLSSISAPVAQRFTQLWVSNAAVSELSFPSLVRTQAFTIQMVPQLVSLDMPALTQIDTTANLFVSASQLPACQVTELITRTGYTGSVYIDAPPCVRAVETP